MPGSWPQRELPNLHAGNCRVTSQYDLRYNCLAWAASETFRNWWPDPMKIGWWPTGVPRAITKEAFVAAYATRGFSLCVESALEPGIQKVAIYGHRDPASGAEVPTHAALQLESGEWTSKLGRYEDIIHLDVIDVTGPAYGQPIVYMSRLRPVKS